MTKILYTALVLVLATALSNAQTPTPPSVSEPASEAFKRTTSRVMEKTINSKKWELTLTNDEVSEVKINGKKLPKAAWSKYQTEIEDLRSSAYALDTEMNNGMSKDSSILKVEDVVVATAGLTEEQKGTQNALEEALLSDNLISNRESYNLLLTEKIMKLNGKIMPQSTLDKYVNIYYTTSGDTRCAGCTFKFQVNKQPK
ncbi:MAG: hypothetical protein JNL70_18085 [Saprospiraceae bacterium]|nr:hypothetical protein [Saprospiraceae bacterium]